MVTWHNILKFNRDNERWNTPDWPKCDKCTRPARWKNKEYMEQLCGIHFAFSIPSAKKLDWESLTEGM